jgi:positive control factor
MDPVYQKTTITGVEIMQDLIREYKKTIKQLRRKLQAYTEQAEHSNSDAEDMKLLRGMIRDLQWSLEWMQTGRQPESRRGIERRAAYQRERPIDPIHFQRYAYRQAFQREEGVVSNEEMQKVEEALRVLTPLEREVYVMSRGRGISYAEIAGYLGMKWTTVACKIERAERKMVKCRERCGCTVG